MRREDGKDASHQEDEKEKSERKRQREKERRTALTGAFEDLSALVFRLDKSVEEGEADGISRKKSRRLSGHNNGEDAGGMTRVDLINRALVIMKRLHQENSELKQSLSRGGGSKNEVMVMVPTLTPADDTVPPPAAAGSFRPPYMPPSYPPGPPQDHPPSIYGSGQSPRHAPHPPGWGPYPGNPNHYGRSPQMDHLHDARAPHR